MHVSSLNLNGSLVFLVIQILSCLKKMTKITVSMNQMIFAGKQTRDNDRRNLACFCLVKLQGSKVKHALFIVSYLLFTWMLKEQFERVPIRYFVNV